MTALYHPHSPKPRHPYPLFHIFIGNPSFIPAVLALTPAARAAHEPPGQLIIGASCYWTSASLSEPPRRPNHGLAFIPPRPAPIVAAAKRRDSAEAVRVFAVALSAAVAWAVPARRMPRVIAQSGRRAAKAAGNRLSAGGLTGLAGRQRPRGRQRSGGASARVFSSRPPLGRRPNLCLLEKGIIELPNVPGIDVFIPRTAEPFPISF